MSPTCECGAAKDRRAMGCPRCLEIDQQRYAAASPSGRVLSFLGRIDADWVTATDLMDAFDPANRADFSAMVAKLVKDGLVERRKEEGQPYEYRLAKQQRRAA